MQALLYRQQPCKGAAAQRRSRLSWAIGLLQSLETPAISPQDMALLFSGVLLGLSWHFLAHKIAHFDARAGLGSLLEVWAMAAAAVAAGQLARIFTPPVEVSEELHDCFVPAALCAASSSSSISSHYAAGSKEGREDFIVQPAGAGGKCMAREGAGELAHHYQQQQHAGEEEDEHDMAAIKRRAQAEAADKLQRFRQDVTRQLAALGAATHARSAVDAQLLHALASQLFDSPVNLSEFVLLGGLPAVLAAMEELVRQLCEQQQQDTQQHDAVLKALLQASWVVLQLAHGPPACRAALQELHVADALLSVAQAVGSAPASPPGSASEGVLRNTWWVLLLMCDPHSGKRGAAEGLCRPVLQHVLARQGVISHLQQLVALRHGLSAGWLAAAQLGLLLQLGQPAAPATAPKAGDGGALACAASDAADALLQPDSLAGLALLMQACKEQQPLQRQFGSRPRALAEGVVHFLLTFRGPELLRRLLEAQLVGSFATSCPLKLGRLLVCQLLSSQGQAVLADVEAEYELDVPLALAQLIPAPLHFRLPPVPASQRDAAASSSNAGACEIECAADEQPDVAAAASARLQQQHAVQEAMAEDTYTDAMACRLLLQHDRLHELLAVFSAEFVAASPAAEQQQQHVPAAVSATLALVEHLMARDLQLTAVQHAVGDSVAASVSSGSSGSSSIDAALAMPDSTGTYSSVLAGLVPEDQLPGTPQGSASSSADLLVLPPLAATASPAPEQLQQQKQPRVVFQAGSLQHTVDAAMYQRIKRSSALVRSILQQRAVAGASSSSTQQQRVVSVLRIPHFTDTATCWVLRCLERWLLTGTLEGFSDAQAAKLWVAADFLQVNGLQVACEDRMLAAARADAAFVPVVLELCARHTEPSARLLRLTVQLLLSRVAASTPLQQLQELLAQHTPLLLPVMHAELRDRLLTLCIQNSNLDVDNVDEVVE